MFGEGNDFDKILAGVSMLAMTDTGYTVIENFMDALLPIIEKNAEKRKALMEAKVNEAVKKRSQTAHSGGRLLMEKWTLPIIANIGGKEYSINSDYRDILEIISYLNNESDQQIACMIALNLFYENFNEMPVEYYQEALDYLFEFINAGYPESKGRRRKLIDWEQDYPMIIAEVNKVAGVQVRSLPYLHWFTFYRIFQRYWRRAISHHCFHS